jgi:hypothetical protein
MFLTYFFLAVLAVFWAILVIKYLERIMQAMDKNNEILKIISRLLAAQRK